jgi:hypothetical protein
LAEGIDGAPVNAASPAVRNLYSFDWFDYDIDLDASAPGAYGKTDFDNRGPGNTSLSTVNGFLYAHAGGQVQLGALGLSATAELFQYDVSPPSPEPGARPEGFGGDAGARGKVTLAYGRYHALAGYGILDDQLVVGAGARIVTLQVKSGGGTLPSGATLLTLDGAGPEVGAVWKPNQFPFRLGATFRSAVGATVTGVVSQVGGFLLPGTGNGGGSSGSGSSAETAGGFILPSVATLPWELEAGFALQLGPRPLNPAWLDPHEMERATHDRVERTRAQRQAEYRRELASTPALERATKRRAQEEHEEILRRIEDQELSAESDRLRAIRKAREANWPRERITILGSLLVTGPSTNAVSLEGFAEQRQDIVGKSVTLTPRVGIESEPVPNWVHARAGSYIEPSRFADSTPRQHFTLGGDIRLFRFSPWGIFGDQIWRITLGADLAPRYQNYGIGFGAWH